MAEAGNSGSRSFPSPEWAAVHQTLALAGTVATVVTVLAVAEVGVEPLAALVDMAGMVLWC